MPATTLDQLERRNAALRQRLDTLERQQAEERRSRPIDAHQLDDVLNYVRSGMSFEDAKERVVTYAATASDKSPLAGSGRILGGGVDRSIQNIRSLPTLRAWFGTPAGNDSDAELVKRATRELHRECRGELTLDQCRDAVEGGFWPRVVTEGDGSRVGIIHHNYQARNGKLANYHVCLLASRGFAPARAIVGN